MPTYDYRCAACGHVLEVFQTISEARKRKCPQCKKPKLERQIGSGAGILFKGSGFYQTDYRSDSYKKSASAENTTAEPKAETSTGAKDAAIPPKVEKKDTKPAAKKKDKSD